MLIREQFSNCGLSGTEQALVTYILEQGLCIRNMTVKEIAQNAYAAPSTLIRIAHKMNYSGWNELKEAFLAEEEYLQSHFREVDANLPFRQGDNIMKIAGKLAALKKEAVDDTLALLKHDDLQKAVQILRKASCIHIFAVSNNLLISQEFRHNMSRIRRLVEIHDLQSEILFNAYLAEPSSCAILISYTGETPILIRCARALTERRIPLIAITSIGENTISRMATCVLRTATREKMYSKIATFVNDASITYLLDVLYSCVFALNYEDNLQCRIRTSRDIEHGRTSDNEVIRETAGSRSRI